MVRVVHASPLIGSTDWIVANKLRPCQSIPVLIPPACPQALEKTLKKYGYTTQKHARDLSPISGSEQPFSTRHERPSRSARAQPRYVGLRPMPSTHSRDHREWPSGRFGRLNVGVHRMRHHLLGPVPVLASLMRARFRRQRRSASPVCRNDVPGGTTIIDTPLASMYARYQEELQRDLTVEKHDPEMLHEHGLAQHGGCPEWPQRLSLVVAREPEGIHAGANVHLDSAGCRPCGIPGVRQTSLRARARLLQSFAHYSLRSWQVVCACHPREKKPYDLLQFALVCGSLRAQRSDFSDLSIER